MRGSAVDMFTLVLFTVHTNNVVSYHGIVRCAGIAAVRHGGDWRKLTVEEIAWAVRPLGEIGGIGRAAMIAAMVQRTSASLYEMSYDEIMELAGISEKVGGCAVSYWRPERWSEVEREREWSSSRPGDWIAMAQLVVDCRALSVCVGLGRRVTGGSRRDPRTFPREGWGRGGSASATKVSQDVRHFMRAAHISARDAHIATCLFNLVGALKGASDYRFLGSKLNLVFEGRRVTLEEAVVMDQGKVRHEAAMDLFYKLHLLLLLYYVKYLFYRYAFLFCCEVWCCALTLLLRAVVC
jgi:hypothetical protein